MTTQPTHTAPMRLDHAERTIRAAIAQALREHAPAHKVYREDGAIATVCTCGLISDGGSLVERIAHLTDVTTTAVVAALHEHAQAEQVRAQHVADGDLVAAYRPPPDKAWAQTEDGTR